MRNHDDDDDDDDDDEAQYVNKQGSISSQFVYD